MIKSTLVGGLLICSLLNAVDDFHNKMPIPVYCEDIRLTDVRKTLAILGRDAKYAKDIYISATSKNIDPVLWTCNFELESEIKRNAISKKGYKSFGQTRVAFQKLGYDTADMMAAACCLEEKRIMAKGDERLAWAYYKGGNNPEARKNVEELFSLYEKVSKQIKG